MARIQTPEALQAKIEQLEARKRTRIALDRRKARKNRRRRNFIAGEILIDLVRAKDDEIAAVYKTRIAPLLSDEDRKVMDGDPALRKAADRSHY